MLTNQDYMDMLARKGIRSVVSAAKAEALLELADDLAESRAKRIAAKPRSRRERTTYSFIGDEGLRKRAATIEENAK